MKFLRKSYESEIGYYVTAKNGSSVNYVLRHLVLTSIVLLGSYLFGDVLPIFWVAIYIALNHFQRVQTGVLSKNPSFRGYIGILTIFTLRMITFRLFVLFVWFHQIGDTHFPALFMAMGAILFSISQGAQLRSYARIQSVGDGLMLLVIALSFFAMRPQDPSSIIAGISALGVMLYHFIVLSELQQFKRSAMDLEERNRQSQKMEAVGRLTGGVAHDFNNILTVVLGNLELYKEVTDPKEKELVAGLAHEAAERASRLTSQLLAFSRQSPLIIDTVEVPTLLLKFTEMARRLLPASITLDSRQQQNVHAVLTDPNQLENALLNLTINARDAMPNGGKIDIFATNVSFGRAPPFGVKPGEYVSITVSDTGEGITADRLEKVFEPFFTTKDVGKGSGLGLSMVKGYSEQSSGGLTIESEPGKGTKVSLFLPACPNPKAT